MVHLRVRLENFPSAFRDANCVRKAIGHDRASATIPPDAADWAADTAHELLGRLSEFSDFSTKSACEIFSALEEEALALIAAVSRLDPSGLWLSRITRPDTVVFRPAADSVPDEVSQWAACRANVVVGRLVAKLGSNQFFAAEMHDQIFGILTSPFAAIDIGVGRQTLAVDDFAALPLADRRRLNSIVKEFVERKGLGARIAKFRPACQELSDEVFGITGFSIDEFLSAHLMRNARKACRLNAPDARSN